MGTYSFHCDNCGDIDIELKPSQIPLNKCPNCECKNIQRIFYPVNSVWKIDGAYSKQNHKE